MNIVENMTSTEFSEHCTIIKMCVNLGKTLMQTQDNATIIASILLGMKQQKQ